MSIMDVSEGTKLTGNTPYGTEYTVTLGHNVLAYLAKGHAVFPVRTTNEKPDVVGWGLLVGVPDWATDDQLGNVLSAIITVCDETFGETPPPDPFLPLPSAPDGIVPQNAVKCVECDRLFDMDNDYDVDEWYHGHDCEV